MYKQLLKSGLGVLVLVLAAGHSPVIAMPASGPDAVTGASRHVDRAGLMQRIAEQLDLTDEQRQTIRGLVASVRPNLDATRREAFEKLEMLRVTNPDHPQYDRVVAQVSQAIAELSGRTVTDLSQLRAQLWAVLTDEQRIRFAELEAQRHRDMMERWRDRMPAGAAPAGR